MTSNWTDQGVALAFADFFSQNTLNDYPPLLDDDALPCPASRELSPFYLSTDDTALSDLSSLFDTQPDPASTSNAADDPFPKGTSIDRDLDMSTFDQDAFDSEWQHQYNDHFPEQITTMTTDGNAVAETAAAAAAAAARIASGVDDAQAHRTPSKTRGSKPGAIHSTTEATRPKRARITEDIREILNAHFNSNPYPTGDELTLLYGKTGLSTQVVRNWFSNARSRKSGPQCKRPLSHVP